MKKLTYLLSLPAFLVVLISGIGLLQPITARAYLIEFVPDAPRSAQSNYLESIGAAIIEHHPDPNMVVARFENAPSFPASPLVVAIQPVAFSFDPRRTAANDQPEILPQNRIAAQFPSPSPTPVSTLPPPQSCDANAPINRASETWQGNIGHSSSSKPEISGDGHYVVFTSQSANLIEGDSNGRQDIFIHDRFNCDIQRLSIASNGQQGSGDSIDPVISYDGRYVAFTSNADDLIPDDGNGVVNDIFIHDRQTGQTTLISSPGDASAANGASYYPDISNDGRFIVYVSEAANLVTGDTNVVTDIFVYDRNSSQTQRISISSTGDEANAAASAPAISGNGRYVVFLSAATNLVIDDTNNATDAFVHDLLTGETLRVSLADTGYEGNGAVTYAHISGDGRYVVFSSEATNLTADGTAGGIFVRDLVEDRTTHIVITRDNVPASGVLSEPRISDDGRYIVFSSPASNHIPDDTNNASDVFIHDLETGRTRRFSVDPYGGQGIDYTGLGATEAMISADGRYITFAAYFDNLVYKSDWNYTWDVFWAHVNFPEYLAPPTNLNAVLLDENWVELSWVDNANDEVGYYIERQSSDGNGWETLTVVDVNSVIYVDETALCGRTYSYQVTTLPAPQNEFPPVSNISSVITSDCPPFPDPTTLSATTAGPFTIDLLWTDHAEDESSYHLERSPDGVGDWEEVAVLDANTQAYQDNVPTCASMYFYRVRAYRLTSDQYSNYSNVASADSAICPPPLAPSELHGQATSLEALELTWRDNSDDETAFHIEMQADGVTWTEIASVSPNTVVYLVEDLICEQVYGFRVRAYRAEDNQFSAFSDAIHVGIPDCVAQPLPEVYVNTTEEMDDGLCGPNHCSLTEAIQAANASVDSTTIHLQPEATYTLSRYWYSNTYGHTSLPTITGNITLQGHAATIERTSLEDTPYFRLFHVQAEAEFHLFDVTLHNGDAAPQLYVQDTERYAGGAILNYGTLTAQNVVFSGNRGARGGAIANNNGVLHVFDSKFLKNDGRHGGGGIFTVSPSLTIVERVSFIENRATNGGGVNSWSDVTIARSNFINNNGSNVGGGVSIVTGAAEITNSTFYNLTDRHAIYVSSGAAALSHNTIYNDDVLGIIGTTNGSVTLFANLIVGTTARPSCWVSETPNFTSLGYNLSHGTACNLTHPTDIVGTELAEHFGELEVYGGNTAILPVLSGPALEAIPPEACTVLIDQRGYNRPQGENCDIGAAEMAVVVLNAPSDLTVAAYDWESASLSWTDNSPDETAFYLERRQDDREWIRVAALPANTTSYTDVGLTCTYFYSYRLQAFRVSDGQASAYSDVIPIQAALCPSTQLEAPTELSAERTASMAVALTWYDHSLDESLYLVERSSDGTNWLQILEVGPFVGAGTVSVNDTSTVCDIAYFYRVRGYRGANETYSTYSNEVSIPAAPDCVSDRETIVVNVLGDTNDGFCTPDHCSLREAVSAANLLTGVTIELPAGFYFVDQYIPVSITADMTLRGEGNERTIIAVQGVYGGVFAVNNTANVVIEDMQLQRGNHVISNHGRLVLRHVLIRDGSASQTGGGVYNYESGVLEIHQSIIRNNRVYQSGGGIYNLGQLRVVDSLISNNEADNNGGGIYNYETGQLTIENSLIYNNHSAGYGGGIFFVHGASPGRIINTTISGNTANAGAGIVAFGFSNTSPSTLTLQNVTSTANVSNYGAGLHVREAAAERVYLHNTIVAGNTSGSNLDNNLQGDLISLGYNILGGGSPLYTIQGNLMGVVRDAQPLLGPLQDNGGHTMSHMPLLGSPAINAARGAYCPQVDQRGTPRPIGSYCDIGAVEATIETDPTDHSPDINVYFIHTPTLSWGSITWATGYEVQVASDNAFTNFAFNQSVLPENTHITTTELSPGLYYWRVRAQRPDGRWGNWSAVESFTIR